VRPSLFQSLTEPCAHCGGSGRVFRPETVVRRVERAVRRVAVQKSERDITIRVHPQVALYILEEESDFLRRLERTLRLDVDLRDDPLMKQDEFRLLAGPADSDVTLRYALG
jgi:ribonuclease G